MSRTKLFFALAFVASLSALMLSCGEDEPSPTSAPLAIDETPSLSVANDPRLSGAIFTTTPDGSVVNENTHYESKLEVYLDGGPGPNAPQHAAGLPDGLYVFQITDPPGKVLLSEDPAKCRVVRIADDIIVERVCPSQLPTQYGGPFSDEYTVGKGGNATTYPCHIDDDPDGAAGASGRHDTNTDVDYGDNGAIVVQMMPFLDTPNPGGVYKAWLTPIDDYLQFGGDLAAVPEQTVKVRGKVLGFEADPGFGPPRNRVKTDNFKVVQRPPMIHVFKYEDLNGNGVKDPGEPEIDGWKITVTETLHDGTTVSNDCYTPCTRSVSYGATVVVSEELPGNWEVSYVLVDGTAVATSCSVTITFGPSDMDRDIVFGNFEKIPKSGTKWHDLDADGLREDGEPTLECWTIRIDGTDGKGNPVNLTQQTNSDGMYEFLVPPGSYTVSELCEPDWHQSFPPPTDGCGSGVYEVEFQSGDVDPDNDFGNYQPTDITVRKFEDCNANGVPDAGEGYLEGWQFCLYDASGNLVSADDFVGMAQEACQTTNAAGEAGWSNLLPGEYTVMETTVAGWYPSTPTSRTFGLDSGNSGTGLFGNYQAVRVTAHKFHDLDGDGLQSYGEPEVAGFEFCLLDSEGDPVDYDDFLGAATSACQVTGDDGLVVWDGLVPGRYEVLETEMEDWVPTTPTEQIADFSSCVDGNAITVDFGNILILCRVTGGQVDESGTCTDCPETSDGVNRFTCGGQAGAPTALQPQPWGEWTHSNKSGMAGRFTFHAGTASAPSQTEIEWISCNDPGYCDPARPAPAKQIDFGGIGTFKNLSGNVPSSIRSYVSVGSSLHYFEVNIDDLGEPGRSGWTDPDPGLCPIDGFGQHSAFDEATCDCPDFYRIRIYATESPGSMLLYEAQGYIAGGNFQIHPLTGHDRN
jgi:hypothetical protein